MGIRLWCELRAGWYFMPLAFSHFCICRSPFSLFIRSTAKASEGFRRAIRRSTGIAFCLPTVRSGIRSSTAWRLHLPQWSSRWSSAFRQHWRWTELTFPGKALFRRLVLLPLILPGIITGLSLLMLFNITGTKLSLLTIVLGHGTALISVATTEVFAGLRKLDRAQEEASLDLGANYWQTFWRVTLPNLKLPIIGAALLIFTLSMDEIAVSFFLIGRDNTLPLEIWGRLRRGITPEINAVSTIIFVFSLVTIVVWYRLRARAEVLS